MRMRRVLTIVVGSLLPALAVGQNLVPNGSYEDLVACPTGTSQLDQAQFWSSPSIGTPDLYNACSSPGRVGVPQNWAEANLPALDGVGYGGCYTWFDSGSLADYREYYESPLTSPLIAGVEYFVRMYVALADSGAWATDRYGAYFSVGSIAPIAHHLFLPFTPQVENTPGRMLDDTVGWMEVSGSFVAAGGEEHGIIGHFADDATTTAQRIGVGASDHAYYFVDAISVTGNPILRVAFDSFAAVRRGDSGVVISWTTLSEDQTLGFLVERRMGPGAPFEPVADVVAAHGPGQRYEVADTGVAPASGLRYRIVEIGPTGPGDATPPFAVEPTAGRRSGGRQRSPQRP